MVRRCSLAQGTMETKLLEKMLMLEVEQAQIEEVTYEAIEEDEKEA